MSQKTSVILALAICAGVAQAQVTRRASIVGSRGDEGKCTIEVRVDIAAEVEITGDMGRIRTLSGQPSSWQRFECTGPIPRNPVDFRFKGIDGRGNVNLLRDPSSGRGTAVVRIDDPKGGAEGYTFDLLWRGGSDYNSGGYDDRFPNRRPNNDRYESDDRRNDRYESDDRRNNRRPLRGGRNDRNIITCASNDGRRTYCDADTRNGVSLLEQHGNSPCRQGSTWGYDRRGIWVDRGCRADFELRR